MNLEQGTGIVHIAPGHGDDDYVLGIKNNIGIIPHKPLKNSTCPTG